MSVTAYVTRDRCVTVTRESRREFGVSHGPPTRPDPTRPNIGSPHAVISGPVGARRLVTSRPVVTYVTRARRLDGTGIHP